MADVYLGDKPIKTTPIVKDDRIVILDSQDSVGGRPAVKTTTKATLFSQVNVKDFGAVGDGSESTAIFDAAIAALPADGGTVYVPDGVYTLALRIEKANVQIVGQSWNSVLKARDAYTAGVDDCPLRIFADNCQVRNIKVDGNQEGNPQVTTSAQAVYSDGIGIYANYCVVDSCHITNCWGHHCIVWNDSFVPLSYPVGARKYNSVRNCLIDVPGLRNPLDFASTMDLGVNYDENINSFNEMVNNVLVDCQITLHTGWDTLIQGNRIFNRDITLHSNCRRVLVVDNIIENGGITIRGGLSGAESDTRRRTQNIECSRNVIYSSNNASIALLYVDRCKVESNQIVEAASDAIQLNSVTYTSVINNTITNPVARGISQPASVGGVPNTWEAVSICGNLIESPGTFGLEALGIVTRSVFEGNKVYDGTSAFNVINAGSEGLRFANNYCSSNSGSCFLIGAPNTVIQGNTVLNCGSTAFVIESNNIHVNGNYVNVANRYLSYPVTPPTGGSVRFNNLYGFITEAARRLPAAEIVFANIGLANQN